MPERRTVAGSHAARSCGSFDPGHAVQWIQWRRSSTCPGLIEHGRIESIHAEEVLVLVDGEMRCYRNHDLSKLADLVERRGHEVLCMEACRLLVVGDGHDRYFFSIATAEDDWTRCSPGADAAGVVESAPDGVAVRPADVASEDELIDAFGEALAAQYRRNHGLPD